MEVVSSKCPRITGSLQLPTREDKPEVDDQDPSSPTTNSPLSNERPDTSAIDDEVPRKVQDNFIAALSKTRKIYSTTSTIIADQTIQNQNVEHVVFW
jgi:hypothetical protein